MKLFKAYLVFIILFTSFGLYAQYEIGMMPADALPEFEVYTNLDGDKVLNVHFQNYEHRLYGLRLSVEQDPYSEYLNFDLHDGRYLDRHGFEGETFEIAKESKPLENFLVRESQEINLTNILKKYYSKKLLKSRLGTILSVDSVDKVRIKTTSSFKTINLKNRHENHLDRIISVKKNDLNVVSDWLYRKMVYNQYDYADLEIFLNHKLPQVHFSQEEIYDLLNSRNRVEFKSHLAHCNSLFIP